MHMNTAERSFFQNIEEVGILPVVCPTNQFELEVLLDAISDTDVKVIEITLRSDFSTTAIKYIKQTRPELTVGAGTVNTPLIFEQALACGADFLVAPGTTDFAHEQSKKHNVPFIHGASTPSEILKLINLGYDTIKFFPAEISGGTKALKLYSSAFKGVKFLPTGGISVQNLSDYLDCPNVLGCGGSFMAPKELLAKGAADEINDLIKKLSRKGNQQ